MFILSIPLSNEYIPISKSEFDILSICLYYGIILIEFIPQGRPLTQQLARYCETL